MKVVAGELVLAALFILLLVAFEELRVGLLRYCEEGYRHYAKCPNHLFHNLKMVLVIQ